MNRSKVFLKGMRDGVPIALGYFAVAFSLGIMAKQAGLNALQGFVASFFNLASAGEYSLFSQIQLNASLLEVALVTLVINARYLLMSCALSQRFSPKTGIVPRLLVGFGITDEIFGISIATEGYLNPLYNYGAILVAAPCWAFGTSMGIIAGNILPLRVVSALSVALYGMFIAIIVPPAKKNKTIMIAVVVSFALSFICSKAPLLKEMSPGFKTIILTVVIASVAALISPVNDETKEALDEI